MTVKHQVLYHYLCIGSWTAIAALALALPAAAARADAQPKLLKADVPLSGTLDVDEEDTVLFRAEVPSDAVLMTVRLTNCPLVLDVFASKDKPAHSIDDADHRTFADVPETTLRVSRQGSPALQAGKYYVAVTYLGALPPVLHKRPLKKIPFTLTLSFVRAKVDGTLTAGKKTAGQLRAEDGSLRTYVVDVPENAPALRIDLDDVSSDLDILARYGEPIVDNEDADDTAISPLGRESLVIDRQSPQPLRPGKWYVNVVHPADIGVVDFTVYVSFSSQPPAALLEIPAFPPSDDGRKRAIEATVDVSTEFGGASGTLLTDDGLILTNYHVVAEVAEGGDEKDPVIVAMTVDPQWPPRELFRGRVIKYDKSLDLALVQVTCGLYRQPLPAAYRFPALTLRYTPALEIGDRVSIIGFPSIGGTGGRVSVTFTQGVVSGFERTSIGMLMKTDANIGPGSSGGAALDRDWRLIGVPTSENIRPEVVGRMSYIHPVSLIPETWQKLIRQRQTGAKE